MARVLVVITPAEGHVNPSLGLVKQLTDNGEEVVYVCTEEYRSRIEQTGAELRTYPLAELFGRSSRKFCGLPRMKRSII